MEEGGEGLIVFGSITSGTAATSFVYPVSLVSGKFDERKEQGCKGGKFL